jgi:glutamate synthase (NADPH/NADH) small chain
MEPSHDWKGGVPGGRVGHCCRSSRPRRRGAWTAASLLPQRLPARQPDPEWNDLVYRERLGRRHGPLHATNNFPSSPAASARRRARRRACSGINQDPVTIKNVEVAIIDRAWDSATSGRSRPSGCRAARCRDRLRPGRARRAQQLTRAGHTVAVYERADKIGGLLRYGIPEFKMEKAGPRPRLDQMRREGTVFRAGRRRGREGTGLTGERLRDRYDAVVLADRRDRRPRPARARA